MKSLRKYGMDIPFKSLQLGSGKKLTLDDVPFDTLTCPVTKEPNFSVHEHPSLASWLGSNYSPESFSWLLPQLYAMIGAFKLPRNSEGKIDGKRFWSENLDMSNPRNQGIYRFMLLDPRSVLINKQNRANARQYCALVPLVLAAVKQIQNIAYSEWDRDTLQHVVCYSLCEAMLMPRCTLATDIILDLRNQGLMYRTGPNTGTTRNASSFFALYGTEDKVFDKLNPLWKVMTTQIWCAHPANRMDCMVLDPGDWDNIPEPLISSEVLMSSTEGTTRKTKVKKEKPMDETELPWDSPWNN